MKNKLHDYTEIDKRMDLFMPHGPTWSIIRYHETNEGWRGDTDENRDIGSYCWADGMGFGVGKYLGYYACRGQGEGSGDGIGYCEAFGKGTG